MGIITTLGYALLGLVRDEPRSGYALRMVFETTPMGNYSSSPGSIYPALKSLEKNGLITPQPTGSKRVFALTPAGAQAFDGWLVAPVTEAEDFGIALLRFAFLHDHPDPQVTLDFLTSFGAVARARVNGLKAYLASDEAQALPLQARLAVIHGLATTQASAEWAETARTELKRIPKSVPHFLD